MKIRPKVPVCTDCDHVFEYRGRNPGQLGGVVVQFGEAYCTKKKKPRLLKRWHNMLRVPDWCKKRIRPSLVRIYDFASTESWLMHENLCKSLGREIGPTASRYTLSEVRQLDLDAYAFQKQVRTTPVEELLNVHLGLHQVVEVFDGVQSVILYKTLDGYIPAPMFDARTAESRKRHPPDKTHMEASASPNTKEKDHEKQFHHFSAKRHRGKPSVVHQGCHEAEPCAHPRGKAGHG